MSLSQQKLKEFERRANYADELARQLEAQFEELRRAGGSSGGGFTESDKEYIREELLSIRETVVDEEKQLREQQTVISKQKQMIDFIKTRVKDDLLQIKKDFLVESAKANPAPFREYVTQQLKTLKQELVQLALKGGIDQNTKQKVIEELKEIRKEVLKEEQKFENFRKDLRARLLSLREDVRAQEDENADLKRKNDLQQRRITALQEENRQFATGDRLPAKLKKQLIAQLKDLKSEVFAIETENKRFQMEAQSDPLTQIQRQYTFTTVDMHSGGEPLRIVQTGLPNIEGNTLLEKRRYFRESLDEFRKFLIFEPRGHSDMYGAVLVEADDPGVADYGVIFLDNSGYPSMSGHTLICLGRYLVDFNKVKVDKNAKEVLVRLQCPCGVVNVYVQISNGKSTGNCRYESVPAWAETVQAVVNVEEQKVEVDIGYGGVYYAIVPASRFEMDLDKSSLDDLVTVGTQVSAAVKKQVQLTHPDSKDLAFLYGTILTDGQTSSPSKNVTIFADRQVDRCPEGSALTARLAVDYTKKLTKVGEERQFVSLTGSSYVGSVLRTEQYKDKSAVIVQVSGSSRYTGRQTFFLEKGDTQGKGFFIK